MDVLVDLIWLFFMQKVAHSFHHNYFPQKWHMFPELIILHKFLEAHGVICKVQVAHNKLTWHFDLTPSPGCCEFPVSALKNIEEN